MKKAINFLINFICVLCVLIVLATVYFCLDAFGIIKVPQKYSIVSRFYSEIEEIIASGEVLNPDRIIDENTPKRIVKRAKSEEEEKEKKDVNLAEELRESINPSENGDSGEGQDEEKIEYEINAKRFYYDQLNDYAKKIYDELNDHLDELKTGTYSADFGLEFNDLLHQDDGRQVLDDAFQFSINALTFDHPDLFYIDVTKIYLSTEIRTLFNKTSYKVTVGQNIETRQKYLADGLNSEDDVNEAIDKVKEVKERLLSECQDKDTIDQIKTIHDYLIDNVEYDSNNGRNVYNVYGTLIDGKSVCEGYARSVKYILDDLDIPCIISCGIGRNRNGDTESHAWNYIYINDTWYALDVTWDDPIIIGNGKVTNDIRYAYFLKGSDKFFENHFEDGNIVDNSNFKYPEISREDY
ncbi:MAG: hypothetical protein K6D97_05075 [Clostridia bacterium]|nr:hypothetical protein [Clostridia bacterium]